MCVIFKDIGIRKYHQKDLLFRETQAKSTSAEALVVVRIHTFSDSSPNQTQLRSKWRKRKATTGIEDNECISSSIHKITNLIYKL